MLDRESPYTNANRLVTLLDNHDLDRRITTEILDRVGHWDRDLARTILKTEPDLPLHHARHPPALLRHRDWPGRRG